MIQSVVGGVTTTYAYNGSGIRAFRTVAGALPVVLDDSGYRYVYGLDLIAAVEDDDSEY